MASRSTWRPRQCWEQGVEEWPEREFITDHDMAMLTELAEIVAARTQTIRS